MPKSSEPAELSVLLLTVGDVATVLRWGRSKAWRYVLEGRIPSVKVDGSRRIRRSDLETYVANLRDDRAVD